RSDETSVRFEHLYPRVIAIGHVYPTVRVDGNTVRNFELTAPYAAFTEAAEPTSVGIEAHDLSVIVTVRDINLAIRSERDRGRACEIIELLATTERRENHRQQHRSPHPHLSHIA